MPEFDRSLPMMLRRTLEAVMPTYREIFTRYGLTDQQWRVLRVLWETDGVTSADLAARTLLPAPSLVGIVDRLEKRELVTRDRSAEDRRRVYVLLTPQGRALEELITPEVSRVHDDIKGAATVDDWDRLEATLAKIEAHYSSATSTNNARNDV